MNISKVFPQNDTSDIMSVEGNYIYHKNNKISIIRPIEKIYFEIKCCICLEEICDFNGNNTTELNCGHLYHTKCIKNWSLYSGNCPICRKNLYFEIL